MTAIINTVRQSRECVRVAIEYARERRTFGKRLIDHQVQSVAQWLSGPVKIVEWLCVRWLGLRASCCKQRHDFLPFLKFHASTFNPFLPA